MMLYQPLPVANQFKLDEMCRFLSSVEGDVVEIGVYQGGSLIHMASRFPDKHFYAYDTFEGMPDACDFDNHHMKGDFTTSHSLVEKSVIHLNNVTLTKGIYPDSDNIRPNVVMAHLDVDIYTSTINSLNHLKNLISEGGRVYCDDVFWKDCEGATRAFMEFCLQENMVPKMKCGQFYLQF